MLDLPPDPLGIGGGVGEGAGDGAGAARGLRVKILRSLSLKFCHFALRAALPFLQAFLSLVSACMIGFSLV